MTTTDATRATFTIDLLEWAPWLERATETDLAAGQRVEVEAYVAAQQNSDYIDVLANDYAALRARALVHRHVYTSTDPSPSANRELAATAASRVTGCVFCASVHARMYAGFSRKRELVLRVLADGVAADLPPLERAVVDLSAKLTTDPEALTAADLAPLRVQGLDDLAILDVINYAAFFANANRLMLSLGEPKLPAARPAR
jgi:uncharacterized peroxidase-related enzyme